MLLSLWGAVFVSTLGNGVGVYLFHFMCTAVYCTIRPAKCPQMLLEPIRDML